MLEDIATLTGGQVISEELGLELKDTTMAQLGRAKSCKKFRKRIQSSLMVWAIKAALEDQNRTD